MKTPDTITRDPAVRANLPMPVGAAFDASTMAASEQESTTQHGPPDVKAAAANSKPIDQMLATQGELTELEVADSEGSVAQPEILESVEQSKHRLEMVKIRLANKGLKVHRELYAPPGLDWILVEGGLYRFIYRCIEAVEAYADRLDRKGVM